MDIKKSLAVALKKIRNVRKITQEDFSEVSSRTYVSTIERGLYSPTVEKIDALAKVMSIHPLTLLTLAYLIDDSSKDIKTLLNQINKELIDLNMTTNI